MKLLTDTSKFRERERERERYACLLIAWKRSTADPLVHLEMRNCAGKAESRSVSCNMAVVVI